MAEALPERLCQFLGTRDLLLREPEARTEGSARRSPPPRDRLAVLANEGHQKRQYPSSYWECRRFGGRNPARASSRRYRRSQR